MAFFTLLKKTNLHEIGPQDQIPESDYSLLTEDGLFYQFKFHPNSEKTYTKTDVKPGIWKIVKTMQGPILEPTSFTNDSILEEFVHTQAIEAAVDCFFENLDLYKEFGVEIPKRAAMLYGPPGCHAKGTKILMFDGSLKNVEDIKIGNLLMGPDSTSREVLKLYNGKEEMVKISPNKGESFIVNKSHMLHLTPSRTDSSIQSNINIKVSDYLKESICFQERYKITKTGIEFSKKNLPIDPYILGLWLGDGTSENIGLTTIDQEIKDIWLNFAFVNKLDHKISKKQTNSRCETIRLSSFEKTVGKNHILNIFKELELINNKHIPQIYLNSSKEQRLQLLAGLIDTDGTTGYSDLSISKGLFGTGYSYVSKSEKLADGVVYLARSLGYAAYKSEHTKGCYVGGKRVFEGNYFYIGISGDLSNVPVILKRKKCKERKQIKNVLCNGFKCELLGEDEYFGFTLDKDHLYLTGDFTIHHNSGKSAALSKCIRKYNDGKTLIIVWHTGTTEAGTVKDFIQSFNYIGVEKVILIAEDLGGVNTEQMRIPSDSSLLSLLDNQEKTFTIPVFIVATTNFPENFSSNITDRDGRFDDVIHVGPPSAEGRIALLNFFSKGTAPKEALDLIGSKKCDKFVPSRIRACYQDSRLLKKTIVEIINKKLDQGKKADKGFQEGGGPLGL